MCRARHIRKIFHMSSYGHDEQTNRKRQYSLSNNDSALCEAKAIFGMTSPRVTVLALFYESVNRLIETKEIKKRHDSKNKLDKRIKTTNPPKVDAICAQDTWKFKEKSNYLKALQFIEQTSSISISAVFYSSLEFTPRDFASRHARLTEQQGKLSKGS